MNPTALHLNLLKDGERLSSSPVRLRVMGPVLAAAACVGCLVWWGVLLMQGMLVAGRISSIKADLDARRSAHGEILARMERSREITSRLEQLDGYWNGRHVLGDFFARLAEVVPADVQFLSLSIPEPAPQNLANPAKPKAAPLLGPSDPVETGSIRIIGRAPEAAPVRRLMDALKGDGFTNVLVRVAEPDHYPQIRSFRQETAGSAEDRMLQFDVEYRLAERRFAK